VADLEQFKMPDSAPEPPPTEHAPVFVDREPPADVRIEKVLLGSVLLDPQYFNEIAEALTEQDFYLDSHVRIFKAMASLIEAGSAVDSATLIAELQRKKELEAVGGSAYIFGLTEDLPRRPVITEYVKLVKSKSQLRQMIGLFNGAITRAQDQSETPLAILEDAESSLLEIAQEANSGKLKTIYQSVEEAGGTESYLRAYTDPELKPGLLTGFSDYDRMTGGLQKSELTIIAARPSLGKTSLAMNIAENVAVDTDNVVAVFSLEMSRISLERRMMASRARVNVQRAMEGIYLGREEKTRLETALGQLVESNIFIDDSATLTPVQLRAKCRRLRQRQGRIDLVIVDYMQLMSAGVKTGSRQEEVAHVSRSLKACAKELEVPVIALAQLHRGPEQRTDKRPMLSDLRESGQIEQDADVVAFIHREEMYDRDNPDLAGLAELILAKQRNGATGIVKLAFISKLTRFDNLARE
jgi:replicative DNA helicase